jgi:hypothetical protein
MVGAEDHSSVEDAIRLDGDNNFGAGIDFSDSEEAVINETAKLKVTPVLKQSNIGMGCRESDAAYFYKESRVEGGGLGLIWWEWLPSRLGT